MISTRNALEGALFWLSSLHEVGGLPYEGMNIREIRRENKRANEGWCLFWDWTVDVGNADLIGLTDLVFNGRTKTIQKATFTDYLRPARDFTKEKVMAHFLPFKSDKDGWLIYTCSSIPFYVYGFEYPFRPLLKCWTSLYRAIYEKGFREC